MSQNFIIIKFRLDFCLDNKLNFELMNKTFEGGGPLDFIDRKGPKIFELDQSSFINDLVTKFISCFYNKLKQQSKKHLS